MMKKEKTKKCSRCKTVKLITNFAIKTYRNNKAYYKCYCKRCIKKYFNDNPWAKTIKNVSARCTQKKNRYYKLGIKNFLTRKNCKYLWFRDKAYLMEQPSIHRINNKGHYILENCRYIERRLNRPTSESLSRGMRKYWKRKRMAIASIILCIFIAIPAFAEPPKGLNGWKDFIREKDKEFRQVQGEVDFIYKAVAKMFIDKYGREAFEELLWGEVEE